MNKKRISKYFRKVGRELAKEFNLKGYYLISDKVGGKLIGVSINRPANSHEIHSPGFYTTDTETYYCYIEFHPSKKR